jgi:tetratricopeptide (TPR) repeat protein
MDSQSPLSVAATADTVRTGSTESRDMPLGLGNLALLVFLIVSIRAVATVHFAFAVEPLEIVVGYPVAAMVAGVVFRLLPPYARRWATTRVSRLLDSRRLSLGLWVGNLIMLSLVLAFTTVKIEWSGPESLEIDYNGTRRTVESRKAASASHEDILIVPTWGESVIRVGSFQIASATRPLTQDVLQIPFYVTGGQSPEYLAIESDLDLALFQQAPRHYLRRAETALEAIGTKGRDREALDRLTSIKDILRMSLVEAARDERPLHLLERFRSRFPEDSWEPVLSAVIDISQPKSRSIERLEPGSSATPFPRVASIQFLRGVLLLRLAAQAPVADRSSGEVQSHLNAASEAFGEVLASGRTNPSDEYRSVAVPAALVFRGIASYYRGDMDDAIAALSEALEIKTAAPALRARAANGVGYISFLKGDLVRADRMFRQALAEDSGFSMAAINQGYMLLATGRFSTARRHFMRLLQPDRAEELQPRDAVLARLGLAHALDESGDEQDRVLALDHYRQVLRKQRLQSFEEIEEEGIARAFVYAAIGQHVYLYNRDYYALEPLAVAMFGMSCRSICGVVSSSGVLGDREQLLEQLEAAAPVAWRAARTHGIMKRVEGGLLRHADVVSQGSCRCTQEGQESTLAPKVAEGITELTGTKLASAN